MKKIIFGILVTVIFSINLNAQTTQEDAAKIFDAIKKQVNLNSNAFVMDANNNKPSKINEYLVELDKSKIKFENFNHVIVDTKDLAGVIEVYSMQYSSESSKYILFIEGKDLTNTLAVDLVFDFQKDSMQIKEILPEFYLTTNSNPAAKFDTRCFKKCLGEIVNTNNTIGQFLMIGGLASSLGCGPCGAAAAAFGAVAVIGCAGGCNH